MDAEELLIFLMNHPWCMFWCGLLMLACSPVVAAALLYLPVAAAALLLYLPVAAVAAADTLHCPTDMPD